MLSVGQIFWFVYANSDEKSAYVIRAAVSDITSTEDHDLIVKYVDLSDGGSSFNSRIESKLYLSNFNYLDVKNTKKLNYIFSNLLDADKFVKAVEAGEIVAERLTPEDFHYGVHMSHCFDGHHSYGCKYGESDICPANPGTATLKLRHENTIRKHLKPIFVEKYYSYVSLIVSYSDTESFNFSDSDIEEKFCIFVEGYKCYTKFPQDDGDY